VVAHAEAHAGSRRPAARRSSARRRRVWRLPPVLVAVAALVAIDGSWKAAAVAAGRGALDTPTSPLKPIATLVVGLLALAGVVLLPRLCLAGSVLVLCGVASNTVSLAVWHAVPNPLAIHVAGGILHFNLADTCVWAGGPLFLGAALWTLWRLPDERFAELVARM
jgi:hypothetical protein